MKTIDQLITEALMTENFSFPGYSYETGKSRITQIAINLKMQKKIASLVGGDYFVDDSFMGHLNRKVSSKDNGETFDDKNILNPNKTIDLMRSSMNTSYKVRIDISKNIFAIDAFNTKLQQYRNTVYFKYIPE